MKRIMESLLKIARVDYMHKEVRKEIINMKNSTIIPVRYEQVMLSPLLDWLFVFYNDSTTTTSTAIPVSLFVSVYPDLNPWVVKDVASTVQPEFYYSYLSTLLSPNYENTDRTAKLDQSLVMVSIL